MSDIRSWRFRALHEAVRSWGPPEPGADFRQHARQVTLLGEAFMAFILDGVVHDRPAQAAPESEKRGVHKR